MVVVAEASPYSFRWADHYRTVAAVVAVVLLVLQARSSFQTIENQTAFVGIS